MTRPDGSGEFFVEGSVKDPYYLVRADGSGRAWIISRAHPAWRRGDHMAELAWDSSGIEISRDAAGLLATRWGASILGPAEWPGR